VLTKEDRAEIKALIDQAMSHVHIAESPAGSPNSSPHLPVIVRMTARAIEVLGTPEKALRWLESPVRSLGDQTPLSLLESPEGISRVEDTLGQIEHGVW
jgi:putative toxin-antitoxin system antitoxin component (TIGR02293 family)